MTTFYSVEMTKVNNVPPEALAPVEHHGKVRLAHVDYTQVATGTAGDTVELCKLPAGRVRLIGRLCSLYHNITVASATLDVGWGAHTDLDGVAVDADPDGLDDGVDVDVAGTINLGTVAAVLAVGGNHLFESEEGVVITADLVGEPQASDVLIGVIAYVCD